jgi:hypothetical protein
MTRCHAVADVVEGCARHAGLEVGAQPFNAELTWRRWWRALAAGLGIQVGQVLVLVTALRVFFDADRLEVGGGSLGVRPPGLPERRPPDQAPHRRYTPIATSRTQSRPQSCSGRSRRTTSSGAPPLPASSSIA